MSVLRRVRKSLIAAQGRLSRGGGAGGSRVRAELARLDRTLACTEAELADARAGLDAEAIELVGSAVALGLVGLLLVSEGAG